MRAALAKIPSANVKVSRTIFKGGLNQETPPLDLDPGELIQSENFECSINGGYSRIAGYERYDGQNSPSDTLYYTLPATITGSWAVNDTISGTSSSATATILGSTDNGFLITLPTDTFTDTEDLQISAATVATCDGAQYLGGATVPEDDAIYLAAAADVQRANINAVPGQGDVLGVRIYEGVLYAFRNKTGGATAGMYKSTTSGWTEVTLDNEISFDTGVGEIFVGDTVTGLTSGASASVLAVVKTTGAWGSNAAGILVLDTITSGPFQSGESLQVSAVTKATSTSASSAITLSPGGRYEFINTNFGGATGTYKMYGVDGVNRGFEFDGTTYVPIPTGMATDTPEHVAVHKFHLFYSFASSIQHSGPGTPYAWSPVLGAGEIALGDRVTGLVSQAGTVSGADANSALLAATRHSTYILYGTSVSDWNLVTLEVDAGAYEYTLQKLGFTYCLDDRGIRSIGASDRYGNFDQAQLSGNIKTWLNQRLKSVVASITNRELNQYRLFFTGGLGLYMTVENNRVIGLMPISFPDTVTCVTEGEWAGGTTEKSFFGSGTGYVYEMEKGTSFDGADIESLIQLTHNHLGSPTVNKRYHRAALEIKGTSYSRFSFGYELGYGVPEIAQPTAVGKTNSLVSTYWDVFTWDNFYWDGKTLAPTDVRLSGSAGNISIVISACCNVSAKFTITGAIIHYSQRRRRRS